MFKCYTENVRHKQVFYKLSGMVGLQNKFEMLLIDLIIN